MESEVLPLGDEFDGDVEAAGGRCPSSAWELSTIGDPVADGAMMCAYRLPAFDHVMGGPTAWASQRLPAIEHLAARYETTSGTKLQDWSFHLALAYYKIAIISAGIAHRHSMAGNNEAKPSSAAYAEGRSSQRPS